MTTIRISFLTAATACAAGVLGGYVVARCLQRRRRIMSRQLLRATTFSAYKHRDQRRKNASQEPYINHPLRVAESLSAIGAEDCVLIAALLHDTVEDTDTTVKEIEEHFGSTVASIVAEVTDDKTLPKETRKLQQIEHAPLISREAKLVKLADKLDNLSDLLERTPLGWTPARVAQYFSWAEKVVQGLRGTNADLERKLDDVFQLSPKAVAAAMMATTAAAAI